MVTVCLKMHSKHINYLNSVSLGLTHFPLGTLTLFSVHDVIQNNMNITSSD